MQLSESPQNTNFLWSTKSAKNSNLSETSCKQLQEFSCHFFNFARFQMKELFPLLHSYIMNSTTIINDLKNIHLPEGAFLFSTDAKSMNANIDTPTGMTLS